MSAPSRAPGCDKIGATFLTEEAGERATRGEGCCPNRVVQGGGSLYLTIRGPWPRDLPNQYVPGVPKAHLIGRPAGWSPLALALAFSFAFPVALPFGLLLGCPARVRPIVAAPPALAVLGLVLLVLWLVLATLVLVLAVAAALGPPSLVVELGPGVLERAIVAAWAVVAPDPFRAEALGRVGS